MDSRKPSLIVTSIESPWPPHTGYATRVMDIVRQLSPAYSLSLLLLTSKPLTAAQREVLGRYAVAIHEVPRRDSAIADRLAIGLRALAGGMPYHAALIEHSFAGNPRLAALRPRSGDAVYANTISWCAPVCGAQAPRWFLDQHNADVQFWSGYARHTRNPLKRAVAHVNSWLTRRFCRQVYPRVGAIVSVCTEDAALSRPLAAQTPVFVIENGVDCRHFQPAPDRAWQPTLLFTGTSASRNMKALRHFVADVYPQVRSRIPECRFTVGGNFSPAAQQEFQGVPGITFTGRIDDMRPVFNRSGLYICPFDDAYGSKLKVAEALAMGMCIVSTPAGVRGMPVQDGESAVLASGATEMADAICRLLSAPDEAMAVGRRGRAVAESSLDWNRVLGPRLRALLEAQGLPAARPVTADLVEAAEA